MSSRSVILLLVFALAGSIALQIYIIRLETQAVADRDAAIARERRATSELDSYILAKTQLAVLKSEHVIEVRRLESEISRLESVKQAMEERYQSTQKLVSSLAGLAAQQQYELGRPVKKYVMRNGVMIPDDSTPDVEKYLRSVQAANVNP